jgi:DNA helicase HerA-like ATPase
LEIVETTTSLGGGVRLSLSEGTDPLTLSLAECSTMTAAVLAKKSSGKTYLSMVLVEEILKAGGGVPVVVVDPMGVWAPGLRCLADGTPSPYKVLTLGGPYGDLPLLSFQGAFAGEVVEQLRPHTVVLDLSDMEPEGQHELVADFGERIYATEKRSPILFVVDEADEFIPQELTGSPHQKRSLKVWDRIVRRGRIKGLGTVLISQRAAVVNKNVLSQIDKLFLLCMVAPSDLDAVESWLRHVVPVSQRSQCLGQLPSLQPGQAFYMAGGASAAFRKFAVKRRGTYDSSRTPEAGVEGVVLEPSRVSPEVLEAARRVMDSAPVAGGDGRE